MLCPDDWKRRCRMSSVMNLALNIKSVVLIVIPIEMRVQFLSPSFPTHIQFGQPFLTYIYYSLFGCGSCCATHCHTFKHLNTFKNQKKMKKKM